MAAHANVSGQFNSRIHIVIKINGETISDYVEPDDLNRPQRQLSSGTFAIQAHDPSSTVYYKEMYYKELSP